MSVIPSLNDAMKAWLANAKSPKGNNPKDAPDPKKITEKNNAKRVEVLKVDSDDSPTEATTKNEVAKLDDEYECTVPLMHTIDLPALILCIAKKKGGKSTYIKQFLRMFHKTYVEIYLISGTAEANKEYDNLFPGVDEKMKVMETVANDQIMAIMESRKEKGPESDPTLLIFDDFIGEEFSLKSKAFEKLVSKGRHFNISIIIATQQFKKVPPLTRKNAEYVVCYNATAEEIKQIYDTYDPDTPKKDFIKMYKKIVKHKGFGLIYNLDLQEWFLMHVMKI